MIKVLTTGSRLLPADAATFVMSRIAADMLQRFGINDLRKVNFIVGDCPTGLDKIIRDETYHIEVFSADWKRYGRAAGPMRNQQMIDEKPHICYAFPFGESRGTYDCVRRARRAGISTEIFDWQDR